MAIIWWLPQTILHNTVQQSSIKCHKNICSNKPCFNVTFLSASASEMIHYVTCKPKLHCKYFAYKKLQVLSMFHIHSKIICIFLYNSTKCFNLKHWKHLNHVFSKLGQLSVKTLRIKNDSFASRNKVFLFSPISPISFLVSKNYWVLLTEETARFLYLSSFKPTMNFQQIS